MLQATVYFAVLLVLGGIIGAVVQFLVSTSGFINTLNLDYRVGLVFGALVGIVLFAAAYYPDQPRCPVCRTTNLQVPR